MNPDEPKRTIPPAGEVVPNPGFYIGAITGVALIFYFLIMRWAGLTQYVNLHLFNFAIMLGGVLWTVRKHSNLEGRHYDYMATLGNGCLTALVAGGLFLLFLWVYLAFDTTTMAVLREHAMFGSYLTPITTAAIAAGEIGTFGMIMAYILMFYVNNRHIQTTKQ